MKEFVNKHLTAIIAAAFALIVVIVLAVVLIGGNNEKKPGTENPGTEVSTEIGTESTEVVGDVEDTETTEVVTPKVPSTEDTGTSETPEPTPEPEKPAYTFTELNKTMYAKSSVNVRALPLADGEKVGSLSKGQAVTVTGQCNETGWYRIDLNGTVAYVSNNYLVDNKPVEETPAPPSTPDVPSGGGENGDTNIQEESNTITVNGMTLDVTDCSAEGISFRKQLAEAGYYNPVWDAETNSYYMLIKRTDDSWYWDEWLCNYIIERGGTPGNGGGNNFCDTAGEAYQIFVKVEQ